MSDLELIFLHIPKTAGISFRRIVSQHYGEHQVFFDYSESPANPISPCNLDPVGYYRRAKNDVAQIKLKNCAVYGHFPILKYDECRALRATFLRDPIERALSQYYFWKHLPVNNHPVHSYMLGMNLTLMEFLQLPHIRGFYTEIFFPGCEIGRFDFRGDFSLLASEVRRFGRVLGMKTGEISMENSNPDPRYSEYRNSFFCNKAAVGEARDVLRAELTFYEANAGR